MALEVSVVRRNLPRTPQVKLRDQIIEEHKNILTEEQKAMLPAKHVSFLPCKTVAKWEGDAGGTVRGRDADFPLLF